MIVSSPFQESEVGHSGIKSLSEMLKTNNSLTYLGLAGAITLLSISMARSCFDYDLFCDAMMMMPCL